MAPLPGLSAGLLLVEIVITMWDFVEEDRSRKLSGLERVTHGILTLNYGAVLGLLGIELYQWSQAPTAFVAADHGFLAWVMTAFASGCRRQRRSAMSWRSSPCIAGRSPNGAAIPST